MRSNSEDESTKAFLCYHPTAKNSHTLTHTKNDDTKIIKKSIFNAESEKYVSHVDCNRKSLCFFAPDRGMYLFVIYYQYFDIVDELCKHKKSNPSFGEERESE